MKNENEKVGKVILMWSPVHGQCKVSTNAALISNMLALKAQEENKNILIVDTCSKYGRQNDFFRIEENAGLYEVFNLAYSKGLNAENFSVFTAKITDNFDILSPSRSEDYAERKLAGYIKPIFEVAKKCYDYTIIDAKSGNDEQTNELIGVADIVIVNLPQEKHILDKYYSRKKPYYNELLKDKEKIEIISSYDKRLRYLNFKKIRRKYSKELYKIDFDSQIYKAVMKSDINTFVEKHHEKLSNLNLIAERIRNGRKNKDGLINKFWAK